MWRLWLLNLGQYCCFLTCREAEGMVANCFPLFALPSSPTFSLLPLLLPFSPLSSPPSSLSSFSLVFFCLCYSIAEAGQELDMSPGWP